ncbi:type VI secretion system baseplate subunit TssF [Paludisphaera mucosa]|uniref:Type VI secretion system baseplate subunit TssF n=1 Tax=Paludisphaera mucosa TaxID=3030827 RepID=A0ABT6FEH7_9BACT|nr:type VI secretion system baseplate subunit TssF [Paludisphaera mucosa]MDG3005788.1 type VI secretion system baseplate subunit TssF [Paludisphaera mucosa]
MKVTDELLDYYSRELVYLRDMGDHFARAQPAVAGLLALSAGRCEDPHVERLMQAFALLTARIRKKLDDRFPEITNALLEVAYPHALRPLPSATVVQFEGGGDAAGAAEGRTVPRGTALTAAVEIDGVRCRFRTSHPVALWPVTVEAAVLSPDRVVQAGKPAGAVGLLRLTLRCQASGGWAEVKGLESLRFYLDGGEPVASVLYECLFDRLCEVWITGSAEGRGPFRRVLPRSAVKPVGFGADESLYPDPGRSFPGYRLLQEFFAFPQKFQFFDLFLNEAYEGTHPPLGREKLGPTIEVHFWLDAAPRSDLAVRPTNFRLGCTPAVNLFRWVPEPTPLTQLQTEYRILPSVEHPTGFEVFSVDRVVSSGSFLEGSYDFQPFYAMRHGTREADREAFWLASRQPSPIDGGTELFLSFVDSRFDPLLPAVEKITAHLTCTNRNLPARLPFGGDQGFLEAETETAAGRARLLMQPTEPLRPPVGRSVQWRLISQLALNHLSLTPSEPGGESAGGAEALRELLALATLPSGDDRIDDANAKMIRGVLEVSHERVAARVAYPDPGDDPGGPGARRRRLMGKPLSMGLEIRLVLDDDAFPGARAFLLAAVLDRFLGGYVGINGFTRLVATTKQRRGTWRWPARSGDRMLI